MKHNAKNFLNNAVKHGVYLGCISIVLTVIYYVLDLSLFNWIFSIINGIISITLSVIFMVMAIKKYRVNYLDGKIKYLQCVLIGFILILVSGLLGSIFTYILYNFIDPDFIAKQMDIFIEKMQNYGVPEEKLGEITKRISGSFNLVNLLKNIPIMAAVISLIVSIFVRKKDNTFESNI
jgi:hypothetical protein